MFVETCCFLNRILEHSLIWGKNKMSCYHCLVGEFKRRLVYEEGRQTQRLQQEIKIQIWFQVRGSAHHRSLYSDVNFSHKIRDIFNMLLCVY